MKNNKYKKQLLKKTRKIREGKKSRNKKLPKYYKSKNILSKKLKKKTKIRSIKYKKKTMINLDSDLMHGGTKRAHEDISRTTEPEDELFRKIDEMIDEISDDEITDVSRPTTPTPKPRGKIDVCVMAHGTMPSDDVELDNATLTIPSNCKILFSSVGIGYLMEQLCVNDKDLKEYFNTNGITSTPEPAAADYAFNKYLREYDANKEFPNLTLQFDSANKAEGIWGIYLKQDNGQTRSVNGKGDPDADVKLCGAANYDADQHDYSLKNIVEKISSKYPDSDINFLVITCSEFHYGTAYLNLKVERQKKGSTESGATLGLSEYQKKHTQLLKNGTHASNRKFKLPFNPNFIAQELEHTKLDRGAQDGKNWFMTHGPKCTQVPDAEGHLYEVPRCPAKRGAINS